MSLNHEIDVSHTESLAHQQIFVVNVVISKSCSLIAEISEGVHHVLDCIGYPEYSIPTFSFSFDELRSPQMYDKFDQQLSSVQPDTRRYLVEKIVEYGMNLVSRCGKDDATFGFLVNARLYVENPRILDEEELAPYRQYDDMDDLEDDMDDLEDDDMNYVEAHPEFEGVKKGIYNGGGGKEEVITCSVCLEDLTVGMELSRLPCSHIFHSSCVDSWLERKQSCPNCRNSLEDENCLEVARTAKLLRFLSSTAARFTSAGEPSSWDW